MQLPFEIVSSAKSWVPPIVRVRIGSTMVELAPQDLPPDALREMADEFRRELFAAAGYTIPAFHGLSEEVL